LHNLCHLSLLRLTNSVYSNCFVLICGGTHWWKAIEYRVGQNHIYRYTIHITIYTIYTLYISRNIYIKEYIYIKEW